MITGSVTRAGQVPAYSFVPDAAWNYEPPAYYWRGEADSGRAPGTCPSLYSSAGYSAQNALRLRLLYNENELVQSVCLAIAAMWKEALGVETELVQMEFKAYLAARADPAQWDVVRVGWTADLQRRYDFPGHDDARQPAEFRSLVQRGIRRAIGRSGRGERTAQAGATCCSRRSR